MKIIPKILKAESLQRNYERRGVAYYRITTQNDTNKKEGE